MSYKNEGGGVHDGVLKSLKYRGHAFGEGDNFIVLPLENLKSSGNF